MAYENEGPRDVPHKLKNVKVIPDGSGRFTRGMGMLVRKDPEDFGYRSWRYAALIEDCVVKKMWVEEGKMDDLAAEIQTKKSKTGLSS